MLDEVNVKVDGTIEDCRQMTDLDNVVNDVGEICIELKNKTFKLSFIWHQEPDKNQKYHLGHSS